MDEMTKAYIVTAALIIVPLFIVHFYYGWRINRVKRTHDEKIRDLLKRLK